MYRHPQTLARRSLRLIGGFPSGVSLYGAIVIAFAFGSACTAQTGEWTWMGGGDKVPFGVPGTLGLPSTNNIPGERYGSASWTDHEGNFWLFGGFGYAAPAGPGLLAPYGALNDLWKFDPLTHQWTWESGSSTKAFELGAYGTLGVPSPDNAPGARLQAVTWTDRENRLWLFGGQGSDAKTPGLGYLNDLWEFSPETREWTWMGGSNTAPAQGTYGKLGTPSTKNIPGNRYGAVSWTDLSGNLWLFGGTGFAICNPKLESGCKQHPTIFFPLNDLWKFDPVSLEWTWMSGAQPVPPYNAPQAVYGKLGQPAPDNVPGVLQSPVAWTARDGDLWLFGGYGDAASGPVGLLNDIWKYSPSTYQWTWVAGSSTAGQAAKYGELSVPSTTGNPGSRDNETSWTDDEGNLWIYGGSGWRNGNFISRIDTWQFDSSDLEWTWMQGSTSSDETGPVWGTLGLPAPANTPGSRNSTVGWADKSGNLWLFGGMVYDPTGKGYQWQNDLWVYEPKPGNLPAATPVFNYGSGTFKTPISVTITSATPGAAIYYTLDRSTPTDKSARYTGPISITHTTTLHAIAVRAGFADSTVAGAGYTIH
jgi:hypothetical protein